MIADTTTVRLAREELGACALIEDLLPLYFEGEVSPPSRELIAAHLGCCERCAGYLAGAQSIRAQLRAEEQTHARVVAQAQPAQAMVLRGQGLLIAVIMLIGCGLGVAGSAGVWFGLGQSEIAAFLLGAVLTVISVGLLTAAAWARAPLTLPRLLALYGGCVAAALGSFLAVVPGEPVGVVLALLFWLLGLAGVWPAIWVAGSSTPHNVAPRVVGAHGVGVTRAALLAAGVGALGLAGALALLATGTLLWGPASLAALLLLIAALWFRRP